MIGFKGMLHRALAMLLCVLMFTSCMGLSAFASCEEGHTPGEAVVEDEVAASCETEGSYDSVVYCSECGAELSRETVPVAAAGHTPGEAVVENEIAASCEAEGSYDLAVYCTACGAELSRETVPVAAPGHTPGEAVIENEIAASCEAEGSYDLAVYCAVCGAELSRETVAVEATGHSWGEGVVTAEPTVEAEGEQSFTCALCGAEKTELIEKLPAPEPVSVCFCCEAEEVVITVYPAASEENPEPEAISAQEDGSFLLLPGEYAYTAEAEGYEPVGKTPFTVEGECLRLIVELTALTWEPAGTPDEEEKEEDMVSAAAVVYDITVQYITADTGTVTASVEGVDVPAAEEGATVTLAASPNEGFALKTLTVNGEDVTASYISNGTYSFEMPDEVVTVTADFVRGEYLDGYLFEKDESGNYLINSEEDWNHLAAIVAGGNKCIGKNFLLTDNISVSRPIGQQTGGKTERQRFGGTFDGGGHTLDVTLNSADTWFSKNKGYVAPFAYVVNTSISNLNVTGTVTTTGQWASGLVGSSGNNTSDGMCTVSNVSVGVTIINNYNTSGGSYANHGGVISIPEGKATVTNTWFYGSFQGRDYKYSGGFFGLNKGDAVLTDCLFNATLASGLDVEGACEFIHDDSRHPAENNTMTRCYSVTLFGAPENAQGTHVQAEEPDGDLYTYDSVTAADGNTYYHITGSNAWNALRGNLIESGSYVLDMDYIAGTNNDPLVVPEGVSVTLDLNGYTVDRNLFTEAAKESGYVILVESGGSLTITGAGTVKGGHNSGNGGGIYVENGAELILGDVTVTENKMGTGCKGGGVYLEDGGTLCVSGDVHITNNATVTSGTTRTENNLYLAGDAVVTVSDSLDSAARIGVAKSGDPSLITSGFSGRGTAGNFVTDSSSRQVRVREGEVYLVTMHTVTVSRPSNGSLTSDKSKAAQGDTVTLTPTPDENYALVSLSYTAGGQSVQIEEVDGAYSFVMPGTNVTVSASFALLYNVRVDEGIEHGTVSVSPDSASCGGNITVTVTPDEGYAIGSVSYTPEDGESVTIDPEDGVYSFAMPEADVEVTASFTAQSSVIVKSYSLTLEGEIGLNFRVKIPAAMQEGAQAVLLYKDRQTTVALGSPLGDTTDEFRFTYRVPAKEIGNKIGLMIVDGEGVAYPLVNASGVPYEDNTASYAVADYCKIPNLGQYAEKGKGAALEALAASLQNYGASALAYFGSGDTAPGFAGGEEPDFSGVTVTGCDIVKDGALEGLSQTTMFLTLQSETTINLRFVVGEGHSINEYTFTCGENTLTAVPNKGSYLIKIENIPAKNLDRTYTVTVKNQANETFTVSCSALSYAQLALNDATLGQNTALCSALKALHEYNRAANAYFG